MKRKSMLFILLAVIFLFVGASCRSGTQSYGETEEETTNEMTSAEIKTEKLPEGETGEFQGPTSPEYGSIELPPREF